MSRNELNDLKLPSEVREEIIKMLKCHIGINSVALKFGIEEWQVKLIKFSLRKKRSFH